MVSPTSARITWTANPADEEVSGYNVIRNGVKLGETSATTYVDETLSQLETYRYSVSANGPDGIVSAASAESPAAIVTAPDVTPPQVSTVAPAAGATGVSVAAVVSATFSESVDPATLSSAFSVRAGATTIPGSVTYNAANRTAEFRSTSAFTGSTVFTATMGTGVRDGAGNALAAAYVWAFTTLDNIPPAIVSVAPSEGAQGVPVSQAVTVVFNEAMDATSINASTVSISATAGGSAIAATVGYNAATSSATITPSAALSFATTYFVRVTTGAKDASGNSIATAFSSSFTTAGQPDLTAPTVLSVVPAGGAAGVAVSTTVTVTFSEAMNASTINGNTVTLARSGGAGVPGTVAYNAGSNQATFTPAAALVTGATYIVGVSTVAADLAGNALASAFVSSFATEAPPSGDTTPPTVTATNPANNATGQSTNFILTATFSEPMDPSSINSSTFTLRATASGAPVEGIVTYNAGSQTAGFNLTSPLAAATGYTATITTGVRDVAGNPLASAEVFAFTTAGGTNPGPPPPPPPPPPPDPTQPAVVSVSPAQHAFNVSPTTDITVTFNKAMDPATINGANFVVQSQRTGEVVGGSRVYNPSTNTATLTPSAPLSNIDSYAITVTTGVKDASGNPLAEMSQTCFTPGSGGAPASAGSGWWSSDNACKDLHIHVTLDQSGSTLSRRPVCVPGNCRIAALTPRGVTYLGGQGFAEVVSATGTVNGANITFSFTTEFGQTFTFTGTFAVVQPGQSTNVWINGSISGATMPTQGIVWEKQGQ
jgi:hypothetical protein